jgi:hypothetical protein
MSARGSGVTTPGIPRESTPNQNALFGKRVTDSALTW